MQYHPLFTDEYLFANWASEFEAFIEERDRQLLDSLKQWDSRNKKQTETQLEGQFVQKFFQDIWGYFGTGAYERETQYTLIAQYPIKCAGQIGGTGKADLALGLFNAEDTPDVPQALCEFKDIKSSLDAPQNRKGNNRSPVKQCLDYLKHSFDQTNVNSTLFPTWGIVTDMNEFRLYYRKMGQAQYLSFVVADPNADKNRTIPLIGETKAAQHRRFLFYKAFRQEMLIAPWGRSSLEKLFDTQIVQEKALEKNFYLEYDAFRKYVYATIVESNPQFDGTKKELVRLTQRFLDRCIFMLFCEDMGKTLNFPVKLVQQILIEESQSKFYSSTGNNIWEQIKSLFVAMREGGIFPPNHTINKFNGGLFESNGQLEALRIPNRVFCSAGQGASPEAMSEIKNSLLYLSGSFNFGVEGSAREKTITLYALGRIFEQSITELEYMEAEAEAAQQAIAKGATEKAIDKAIEQAPSIAKLSKRKRNGVYYTPEWVTNYIVRETIGARLADERDSLELEIGREFTENQLSTFRKSMGKKGRADNNVVTKHIEKLDNYQNFLANIKILDPACGSGAFLIQSLQFLLSEHEVVSRERERLTRSRLLFEQDEVIRDILTKNLYGVDLSPESVEIAQLALWLNTARKDKPLSTLDHHIREGNSLVGPDFETFYKNKHNTLFGELDADKREKVNPFDWQAAFPEVFNNEEWEQRGFDCIVGNPPYVKLQNFRTLKPDESDYLMQHRNANDVPVYYSTQTGNCDLYLPFIERGISLLNAKGRMGYIAPNVWIKNKYGEGLRKYFQDKQSLDRWLDFQDFQVFDEATTYTALQFFTRRKSKTLSYFLNPSEDVSSLDWSKPQNTFAYLKTPSAEGWHLKSKEAENLLNRLHENSEGKTIGNLTKGIFVGIQTSMNDVYHLVEDESGSFFSLDGKPLFLELEPELIGKLVKGPDVKRYLEPKPDTRILVPYRNDGSRSVLLTEQELKSQYPNCWKYLKRHEAELRQREKSKMDVDDGWWGFNYPKNIEKQKTPRLLVAGTAQGLILFCDHVGEYVQDDRRVFAITPKKTGDLWYLLGLLNSPVVDFCFRTIARPKDNGFFDIEKQFIEPLPAPNATGADTAAVATFAKQLQAKHTEFARELAKLQTRLDSPNCSEVSHTEDWLWAEVKSVGELKADAPPALLTSRDKASWAKDERQRRCTLQLEKIDAILRAGMKLTAIAEDDAVLVKTGPSTLIAKYGLEQSEANLLAAIWSQVFRTTNITSKFSAERLVKKLLNFRTTDDQGLRVTILKLNSRIIELAAEIDALESEINKLVYKLYDLSKDEIKLVESASA